MSKNKKNHQTHSIEESLRQLSGQLPQPRHLSENEKDELIKKIGGPRTVRSILKAKETLPSARIPFLFSSLDTQLVMDVLYNDWEAALQRIK